MYKKTLAVIFGGQSSEHEISCMSAVNIISNINTEKYELILIGITKAGHWLKVDSVESICDNSWQSSTIEAVISPDASDHAVLVTENGVLRRMHIDAAFPVLHGLFGEDGTIQGLLTLAHIPYVGCGVLSSAVSMDKFFTKIVANSLGIQQAHFVPVFKRYLKDMDNVIERIEATLEYPVFVKPSNAGSSCGVSKAKNREELVKALLLAAEHDVKILVEETIVGRELECAVFSNSSDPIASGVGEILAADEFYSYDAKYINAESKTVTSPELSRSKAEEIKNQAIKIFRAVDGYGLARVDFFLEENTNRVVFNELNTMPGFTAISMYPMLFEAAGTKKSDLIEMLIESAFNRECQ